MSMPSTVLSCDSCEDQTNTFILFHDFFYVYNNIEIAASKGLGYCHECETLSVIENFDDIDYSLEQIENCSDELVQQAKKRCSFNLTRSMAERNASYAQNLTAHAYLLAISLKRKGDERCFSCLSKNIVKFDGDMSLPFSAGCFEGEKKTGFKHPDCGGEYIVYGSESRFNIKQDTRYYTISEDWQLSEVDNLSREPVCLRYEYKY